MKKSIIFTILLSVCTIMGYAQAGQVKAKNQELWLGLQKRGVPQMAICSKTMTKELLC